MDWDEAKEYFECDGSLRDLYVHNTDETDWHKMLAAIGVSDFTLDLLVNGAVRPLSDLTPGLLHEAQHAKVLLSIDLADLKVHCHFFAVREIEFDVDPRAVYTPECFDRLLAFMRLVGTSLGKSVELTPENIRDDPYIHYDPETNTFT